MSKIKKIVTEAGYLKFCVYVASGALLLSALYFIVRNFGKVLDACGTGIQIFFSVLSPLFIGLVLAYLLSPLVDLIQQKGIARLFPVTTEDPLKAEKRTQLQRTISVLFTFLLIFLAFFALLLFAGILIVGNLSFHGIDQTLPALRTYFTQYEDVLNELAEALPASGLQEEAKEMVSGALSWIYTHFNLSSIFGAVSSLKNGILNFVLGVVVAIYLIKDKDFFLRLWRKLLHLCFPMKAAAHLNETLTEIDGVLSCFLRGQLLDALVIAVLSSVALTLCGLPYSVLIGCFAGLANVIPYFGPILGMIPAFFVGLLTIGPGKGLLAVVILLVIQQIDGNIIYPRIVGSSIGLHPVFVLLAVTIGGYFFGILGMLLAVPVAAIIKLFLTRAAEKRESVMPSTPEQDSDKQC